MDWIERWSLLIFNCQGGSEVRVVFQFQGLSCSASSFAFSFFSVAIFVGFGTS